MMSTGCIKERKYPLGVVILPLRCSYPRVRHGYPQIYIFTPSPSQKLGIHPGGGVPPPLTEEYHSLVDAIYPRGREYHIRRTTWGLGISFSYKINFLRKTFISKRSVRIFVQQSSFLNESNYYQGRRLVRRKVIPPQ